MSDTRNDLVILIYTVPYRTVEGVVRYSQIEERAGTSRETDKQSWKCGRGEEQPFQNI